MGLRLQHYPPWLIAYGTRLSTRMRASSEEVHPKTGARPAVRHLPPSPLVRPSSTLIHHPATRKHLSLLTATRGPIPSGKPKKPNSPGVMKSTHSRVSSRPMRMSRWRFDWGRMGIWGFCGAHTFNATRHLRSEGPAHLTHDLPLHHKSHGHVQSKQLPLHLEFQVVLRRFPLQVTTSLVSGRWMRARRRRLTFSNLSRILLVDVTSAARLRGPCLSVSWRPKLLVVSWTVAALSPLPGTMRRESCGHVGFNCSLSMHSKY